MSSMASSTHALRTARDKVARPQSLWRNVWRRFCRHRLALLGLLVLLALTVGFAYADRLTEMAEAQINDDARSEWDRRETP